MKRLSVVMVLVVALAIATCGIASAKNTAKIVAAVQAALLTADCGVDVAKPKYVKKTGMGEVELSAAKAPAKRIQYWPETWY